MENKERFIKRLKNLLALSTSPNEHEAAAALRKARELMDKYQLTEEDVALSEVLEAETLLARAHPTDYDSLLIHTIGRVFRCYFFLRKGTRGRNGKLSTHVVFVGVHFAAELAAYAYMVFSRKQAMARKLYFGSITKRFKLSNRIAKANAFALGWAAGVEKAAADLMASFELPSQVSNYIERLKSESEFQVTKSRASSEAGSVKHFDDLGKGIAAGQKESINIPLNGKEEKGPLRLF